MNASRRLVLNTGAIYARSILGAGLALFSGRWLLNAMGQTDFGLFSTVGSLIVFITFLNSVLAGSAGRHYAFAIGQGNPAEVNHWFNAALSIHFSLAVALILLGWPIGEYVIAHTLNIPANRISVCVWVFRVSLLSAFTGMVSVPFIAMFIAKQQFAELSIWGVLQSILTFTLAGILTIVSGDRLLFYAIGMVSILISIQVAQILRAVSVFRECGVEYRQWRNNSRRQKLFAFSIWNLIGGLGVTLRDQGSAILLNLFFGPRVNAAFGIASQVSVQTNQLASAMLGAISPEVTSSEARGERNRMLSLSHRSCKFGTVLSLFFAVPLIAEMDYVLKLWLTTPPAYTAVFCQLILCSFLIDRLSAGYMLAVNAKGRVAAYQATLGTILVLTLPLAWLFITLGYPPTSVSIASLITMAGCSLGRVFWVQQLFDVPPSKWLSAVLLPCVIVASTAGLAALAPSWLLTPSLSRVVLASTFSSTAWLLTTWSVALDSNEREFIKRNTRGVLSTTWRLMHGREAEV